MKELEQLALKYGTDKSSAIHNYAVKYEKYLPFTRKQEISILEIGVLKGNSLRMWRDYYPCAGITGIDNNPACSQILIPGVVICIGSQTDAYFIQQVAQEKGPFDLIIDDGSHVNNHVINSFIQLFQYLNPGGVYAIEDSCTSYWPKYGGNPEGENTTMSYFKHLTDDVSFYGAKAKDVIPSVSRRESALIPYAKLNMRGCMVDIESINFLNSLILITKR